MFSENVQQTSQGRFVYTQVAKTGVSREVKSFGSGFPIGAQEVYKNPLYRKKYYGVRDSSRRVTASEKKRGAR